MKLFLDGDGGLIDESKLEELVIMAPKRNMALYRTLLAIPPSAWQTFPVDTVQGPSTRIQANVSGHASATKEG